MTSTNDGTTGRPADAVQRDEVAQGDVPGEELVAGPGPGGREPLEVVEVRTGMFGAHGSGDTSGYGGLVRPVVLPGPSARPYGGWFDEAVDVLAEVLAEAGVRFEDAVEQVVVDPPGPHAELTLHVRPPHVVTVARALRDEQDLRFELSMGVSGVHYPHDVGRELHAVYHLTSMTHNRLIRVEVTAPDSDPHVPSLVSIYPTLDWHERETYDMFGLIFDGHPALTRVLMPDD